MSSGADAGGSVAKSCSGKTWRDGGLSGFFSRQFLMPETSQFRACEQRRAPRERTLQTEQIPRDCGRNKCFIINILCGFYELKSRSVSRLNVAHEQAGPRLHESGRR